jgi:precorrin-6Y C5,15-methyltransferase (decarboxylating)
VIGIGEDGLAGIDAGARSLIDKADALFGGARHLAMAAEAPGEKIEWLRPLDDTIPLIERHARPVVLTTGDPLWFGVGRRLIERLGAERVRIHPHVSSFQIAAARLRWSLPDVATVTCHGRPIAWLSHHIAPGRRILVLTDDDAAPHRIRNWLDDQGFGIARMLVLERLGGTAERIGDYDATAAYDRLNIVALECARTTRFLPPAAGLDDDLFIHDGKMTKAEVRAVTLARLMPQPHGMLWDVGAGSGSISFEWLRLSRYGRVHAIEPVAARVTMIERNAERFGGHGLNVHATKAPGCFDALPEADAIFIGGGLSEPGMIEAAWARLSPAGRLVANAVTLEGEAVLLRAFEALGGELSKIAVNRAEAVGPFHGWRPLMPVTQWFIRKGPIHTGSQRKPA